MDQSNQSNQNNRIQKQGKRISTESLIKYIQTNKDTLKSINFVDLNEVNIKTEITSLEKAKIQTLIEINYLPPNLSNIFNLNMGPKYLHCGCLNIINQNGGSIIVSFYSSILSCLIQQFFISSLSDQILFTIKLINTLKKESSETSYSQFAYKKRYGWKPDDIKNDISSNIITPRVMKFVADYFHINIFILDLEKDMLFFGGDEYIPYKRTIFLIKYADQTFEPLYLGNNKVFTVDNELIKDIRNNLDCVNIFQFTDRHLLGLEETEEELINYLPKQTQIKIKTERPELEYDRQITEKKREKIHDKHTILKTESCESKYDENMNAYDENSDYSTDNDVPKKKIKQLSEDEEIKQSKQTKPTKKTKLTKSTKSTKPTKPTEQIKKSDSIGSTGSTGSVDLVEPIEEKNVVNYKISDIKSTLKLEELKEIAKKLNLPTKGTKSVLIESIKEKLNKKTK